MKHLLTLLWCLLFFGVGQALAVNCGDVVTGNFVLNQDLVCNSSDGLIVGASNTKIWLNSHHIKCVGNGAAGSCQWNAGSNGPTYVGIKSDGFDNVQIWGVGWLEGFTEGVNVSNGYGVRVSSLFIQGPMLTQLPYLHRGYALGIRASNTTCPIVANLPGKPAPATMVIDDNTITNQQIGIQADNFNCGEISWNVISTMNSINGSALGISLNGAVNKVYRNNISWVGNNKSTDTGMLFQGPEARNNEVTWNDVSKNCGNGIMTRFSAHHNRFYENRAVDNSTIVVPGVCYAPQAPFTFYDLRELGVSNTYGTNNVCKTSLGVPVGVCNANEN